MYTRLIPASLCLALFTACGGGGGGGGGGVTNPAAAPSDLSYAIQAVFYLLGIDSGSNTPVVTGTVDSYSIAPALPTGMTLDPVTGEITGTPTTEVSKTAFTITATNAMGFADTVVTLGVTAPPRFAYVPNADDDTISIYTVDAHTGELRFNGYQRVPLGETKPEQVIVHPSGVIGPTDHVPSRAGGGLLDAARGRLPVMVSGGFDFVDIDDPFHVTANPHVQRGLGFESVHWAWTAWHAGYWIPITWMSHMVDVDLFGLSAGGHHATNVLLHLANTLLLFALLRGLTGSLGASALAAALFALHPLRVESVAWVTERKDVLSGFLGLLSIAAYDNGRIEADGRPVEPATLSARRG
ncbi:MAG TPA: hypothetical protein EYQ27_14260, partial [Gemmatimonadetes bacterium]|nr:hypothetical protein [Gemmatimonadota bacterium]